MTMKIGLPTVQDILEELEKPGVTHTPRVPKAATFREGVGKALLISGRG